MKTDLGAVALECLLDLGVTVGYALIAALAIVAIVASDNGSMSVVHTALYALLLPGGALALIGVEILLRVAKDITSSRRDGRRCRAAPAKASA